MRSSPSSSSTCAAAGSASVERRRQRLGLPAGRRGERRVLVLDQEHGRLGVVELEAKLRRGQPPVERDEHEAGLCAGEEDDHVLGRVAGQRRDAVAAPKPAREQLRGESVRPPLELRVRHLATEVVDRDALGRAPCRVAKPAAERVQAHATNSSTSAVNSRGRSHGRRCPTPSKSSSLAPSIASASRARVADVDDVVLRPVDDERRHADLAEPRGRVVRGARAREREPARADPADAPRGTRRSRRRARPERRATGR